MANNQEQLDRINLMENYLVTAELALKNFESALNDYNAVQGRIHELAKYYNSDEWRKDFDDDNNGMLPTGLKRGVLSEDAVYNVLSTNNELLSESLEVIAKILRYGRV